MMIIARCGRLRKVAAPACGTVTGMPRDRRDLVIVNAEVEGRLVDLASAGGVITAIGATARNLAAGSAVVLDAAGAAVIPGLNDHHVHLLATAAARDSLEVGPPTVATHAELATTLALADPSRPPGEWLRAVGYHESVAGDLDRDALDRIVPARPVRVQHRSGAVWILNSAALRQLGIDDVATASEPSGVERDRAGRATGRLFRLDHWLRSRVPAAMPDLAPIGRELAVAGVVGCTDATPWPSGAEHERFAEAVSAMPQRVLSMAAPGAVLDRPAGVPVVATKVVLGDHDLPALADIEMWFAESHAIGRPVAVHAVTAEALALAIAAFHAAGVLDGDRIEHAAVTPARAVDVIRRLGVRVVTQPGMVAARGDSYLDDMSAAEHEDLWRCASFVGAGVPTAAGSDAPHGPLDPWVGLAAAVDRRTQSGRTLGEAERLDAVRALRLWLSGLDDPGGRPRTIAVGAAADLCVLDRRLAAAVGHPVENPVVATVIGGEVVHSR